MNLAKVETSRMADVSVPAPSQHLRDHLECALRLARAQQQPVVLYLVEMAILAMSSPASAVDRQSADCDAPP